VVKEGGAHAVHAAALQLAGNVKKYDLSERGEAVQGDRRRPGDFLSLKRDNNACGDHLGAEDVGHAGRQLRVLRKRCGSSVPRNLVDHSSPTTIPIPAALPFEALGPSSCRHGSRPHALQHSQFLKRHRRTAVDFYFFFCLKTMCSASSFWCSDREYSLNQRLQPSAVTVWPQSAAISAVAAMLSSKERGISGTTAG